MNSASTLGPVHRRGKWEPDDYRPPWLDSPNQPSRHGEPMNDVDRELLNLAGQWFKDDANLETITLEKYGMRLTRFWQVVNGLIDRPEALAYNAQTVRRLQRIRENRKRARAARRAGHPLNI